MDLQLVSLYLNCFLKVFDTELSYKLLLLKTRNLQISCIGLQLFS